MTRTSSAARRLLWTWVSEVGERTRADTVSRENPLHLVKGYSGNIRVLLGTLSHRNRLKNLMNTPYIKVMLDRFEGGLKQSLIFLSDVQCFAQLPVPIPQGRH